jgi:hypothetical protein
MGYVIGSGTFPSTWLSMRTIVTGVGAPPPAPPPALPIIADHNQEWPASPAYLKTIEGNGFIRISTPGVSGPAFQASFQDPPLNDRFYAVNFADPYPEELVGRGVTTAGSAFIITVDAFDVLGQDAGSGGEGPISVEWFTALT